MDTAYLFNYKSSKFLTFVHKRYKRVGIMSHLKIILSPCERDYVEPILIQQRQLSQITVCSHYQTSPLSVIYRCDRILVCRTSLSGLDFHKYNLPVFLNYKIYLEIPGFPVAFADGVAVFQKIFCSQSFSLMSPFLIVGTLLFSIGHAL